MPALILPNNHSISCLNKYSYESAFLKTVKKKQNAHSRRKDQRRGSVSHFMEPQKKTVRFSADIEIHRLQRHAEQNDNDIYFSAKELRNIQADCKATVKVYMLRCPSYEDTLDRLYTSCSSSPNECSAQDRERIIRVCDTDARGMELSVCSPARLRRTWAVRQVLSLQKEVKQIPLSARAVLLRACSLKASRQARIFATHMAYGDSLIAKTATP